MRIMSELTKDLKENVILDYINDLVLILNENFIIEDLNNRVALKLLGYSKNELIGKNIRFLFNLYNDHNIKDAFEFSRKETKKQVQILHKDGYYIWFESKLCLINVNAEKKYLIIFRDISEERKTAQTYKNYLHKINIVNQIILEVNEAQDLNLLLDEFLIKTLNLMKFDGGGIYLVDTEKERANLISHKNLDEDFINQVDHIKIKEKKYSRIFIEGKSIFSENYQLYNPKISERWGFLSIASVPLSAKGKIIGALNIISRKRYVFSFEEKEILQTLARELGTVIEKMKAEEALRESQTNLRVLFESLRDFIFIVDFEGYIINANTIVLKRLKYTEEELIGKHIIEIHPVNMRKEVKNTFQRMAMSELDSCDFPLVDKAGRLIPVETKVTRGFWGSKEVIFGISRDITDRVKAEQVIRESEEKYRYLFENSPFTIILIDLDGNIIDCNPSLETLIMRKKENLIGNNLLDLKIISPKYHKTVEKHLELLMYGVELSSIDLEIFKNTNHKIWVNFRSSMAKLGNKTYIQIICHNITQRKKAEEIIKKEVKKLKEIDQIRRDLITRVSHELKTPLMTISGSSELLMEVHSNHLKTEVQDLIEMIDKGRKRLHFLVENLIDVSRIEYRGEFKLKKQKFNLSELIRDCATDMKQLKEKRNISMELRLPETLNLEIDGIRIEQVLTNLLSNAIKNTPPEGKITIFLTKDADWAIITVSDTGVGLTEEEMNNLFTRFGKIERYESGLEYLDIQGAGLGLFISKSIVDMHNGMIMAQSEGRGHGSTFTVKLPLF
ncbi:MAG: PAS domain S-box protein [Candidatus Lokiarchaeota archaeon]|nr:PAS domain S-box protein [Candidatus Lokiarchaeota archaeon]